jgi:hypothetical protein
VIVTTHVPGYLPGVSVVSKIACADAVVWLDDVRFTMPGWINRNQLSDGTWLTVPVDRRDHRTPIHQVTIAGGGWRAEHAHILREHYDGCEHYNPCIESAILNSPLGEADEPLVDLNLLLTSGLFDLLGMAPLQWRQSELNTEAHGSLSSRLAKMVRAVGGTTYLSGPSPHLDPDIFEREGVRLSSFTFAGPNPSVIDPLFRTGQLPTGARQEVSVA